MRVAHRQPEDALGRELYTAQAILRGRWLLTQNMASRSRRAIRPSHWTDFPSNREGAGNAGCALHPRSRVQDCADNAHTSIQVQSEHSGIPRAMALRLMARSPRRRIRLVTVTAGLMAETIRLDRIRHRQFDTSNGCQNHTLLPYAATRLRQKASPGFGVVRLRVLHRSRKTALRSVCAPTLPRPPHPLPRFVTIAIRPSCRERMGQAYIADLPDALSGIFFARGLDRFLPDGC